ncbi:MAG: hypothetical protein A2268_17045 [Candidatus Raymondbacteria bacterium RifOxyA12_full_50_37]|uniref:STAS domain-containing protein n=1 Tax=Candidatus Raymondbacteria bacterium RIFOXYD12_FULL_49_13 TaxID=1817890 RepID=A0A1F7FCK8_UNCRA|nr:MAG: hypothetical protein A2268_17045 [Candidatus Raymondbacteria bacterium RifOxyA12_full_50_37]OGJ86315.1 MAG: hypothetical protein A2248_16645 [Candidatus Raymondbacteria bacterium RIFOXYA2_FULL_49_16]OGJ89998.1 MAG: hypothetical protein A2350_08100 [Candidatus Raymondbacteria bacterium RifOxyB12_full_50_8]OGJ95853.1 MAG: hypothetical protein A2453_11955 [Candidatus Raymondbacteria bacterium RIFOXYC2_FULL_50_21]OGJ97115.1 MAG: hypothetical protein A2487_05020 [Candidatus Raymondbacteria b
MDISVRYEKDVKTVRISGDINLLDIDRVQRVLAWPEQCREIRFDLAEVDFVNTSFVNMLCALHNKNPQRKLSAINPSEFVRHIFSLTQVDSFVTVIVPAVWETGELATAY